MIQRYGQELFSKSITVIEYITVWMSGFLYYGFRHIHLNFIVYGR